MSNYNFAPTDFDQIIHNDIAKRALEIALLGGFGVKLVGFSNDASAENIANLTSTLLSDDEEMRVVYPSVSLDDLLGTVEYEGIVSQLNGGVLVMMDAHDAPQSIYNHLRPVCASGEIALTSTSKRVVRPAHFTPVLVTKPCPCGHYGDTRAHCGCSLFDISNHRAKINSYTHGVADLTVHVAREQSYLYGGESTSSEQMRQHIANARTFRAEREAQGSNEVSFEAKAAAIQASADYLCTIEDALAIARACADLDCEPVLSKKHVEEALVFLAAD